MRETTMSADDVAIEAAKEKLVSLRTRPGFEQAMQPDEGMSGRPRLIALLAAAGFAALTFASYVRVSEMWLQITLALVFAAFAVFSLLAAIGLPPAPQAQPTPAVVLAKTIDALKIHRITLLLDSGETRDLMAYEGVWTILRAGDVGVAQIRPVLSPILVEFHRL